MDTFVFSALLLLALVLGGLVLARDRRIKLLERHLENVKPDPGVWSPEQISLAVSTWYAHQDEETQRACRIWVIDVDAASRDLMNKLVAAWNRRHAPMIVPLQPATPAIEPFHPNPETVRVARQVTGETDRRELALAAVMNAQRFVHATPPQDVCLSVELSPTGEITGVHVQRVNACSVSQVAPGLPGPLDTPDPHNAGDVAA
jgi:hypothetical protein